MGDRLKVVALNGSPHGAAGNISQMIQMVASALSQEDILVEVIHLAEKRVEYCVGCGICLQKGECWRFGYSGGYSGDTIPFTGRSMPLTGIMFPEFRYHRGVH